MYPKINKKTLINTDVPKKTMIIAAIELNIPNTFILEKIIYKKYISKQKTYLDCVLLEIKLKETRSPEGRNE